MDRLTQLHLRSIQSVRSYATYQQIMGKGLEMREKGNMDLPFLLCCPIKVEARDFQILGPGETLVICLMVLTDLCMIFPDILAIFVED